MKSLLFESAQLQFAQFRFAQLRFAQLFLLCSVLVLLSGCGTNAWILSPVNDASSNNAPNPAPSLIAQHENSSVHQSISGQSVNGQSLSRQSISARRWSASGLVALSRPAPAVCQTAVSQTAISQSNGAMLGFAPVDIPSEGTWLHVDRGAGSLKLMDGPVEQETLTASDISHLPSGSYEIVHKQRNPLWYAPDTYFEKRQLPVPPTGSKQRYLRGALGDYVIYLDKDTPLHNGVEPAETVGGVHMPEDTLSKLYYLLEVGAVVFVR